MTEKLQLYFLKKKLNKAKFVIRETFVVQSAQKQIPELLDITQKLFYNANAT